MLFGYPPRERWVGDAPAYNKYCLCCLDTHLVRGGSVMLQPTTSTAYAVWRPTSHEVGMTRPGDACSLQHQEPTSHEVGMKSFRASKSVHDNLRLQRYSKLHIIQSPQ